MDKSKTSITVSRIIELVQLILGGLWALLFIWTAIYSMIDDVEDAAWLIITLWVLGLLGVWVFLLGIKRKKLRLEFKKYVTYLSTDPTGSLDGIASASGVPVETVKKNLNAMIRKNYFTNAYIDHAKNRLVLLTEAAHVGAVGGEQWPVCDQIAKASITQAAIICAKRPLKNDRQNVILNYNFIQQSTTHAALLRVSLITVLMRRCVCGDFITAYASAYAVFCCKNGGFSHGKQQLSWDGAFGDATAQICRSLHFLPDHFLPLQHR